MATSTNRRASPTVLRDPRITQRRKQVKQSKTRKRLWIIGVIIGLLAVVIGGWALLHTSFFSAKTITVVGAVHETPSQVMAAAGVGDHPALISINVSSAEAGVDSLPWVKSSSIALHWPSTVKIVVVERTPVVTVAVATGVALIDGTGRVLSIVKSAPVGMVPVTLTPGTSVSAGGMIGDKSIGAVQVATTLPVAFKSQVALIQANSDGTVTLHLTTPVSVDLGTPTQLVEKYNDIASVIAGATLHSGDVIDVSVPQASTITGP